MYGNYSFHSQYSTLHAAPDGDFARQDIVSSVRVPRHEGGPSPVGPLIVVEAFGYAAGVEKIGGRIFLWRESKKDLAKSSDSPITWSMLRYR